MFSFITEKIETSTLTPTESKTRRFHTTKLYDSISLEFPRDYKEGEDRKLGNRKGFVSYFNKRLQRNRRISCLSSFLFVNGDEGRTSKVIDSSIVSFFLTTDSYVDLSENSV